MTSGKAQFNAPPPLSERIKSNEVLEHFQLKDSTRQTLKSLLPSHDVVSSQDWEDDADNFVDWVQCHAQYTFEELKEYDSLLSKVDALAERRVLLTTLRRTIDKLHNMSPEFDRLLGLDAEPEDCLDSLIKLIHHVENAEQRINEEPIKPRIEEFRKAKAAELSVRILQLAQVHGIKITATGGVYFDYENKAAELLELVGKEIGLIFSLLTWRDYILLAKKQSPFLK